jgi:hypothetical protein
MMKIKNPLKKAGGGTSLPYLSAAMIDGIIIAKTPAITTNGYRATQSVTIPITIFQVLLSFILPSRK